MRGISLSFAAAPLLVRKLRGLQRSHLALRSVARVREVHGFYGHRAVSREPSSALLPFYVSKKVLAPGYRNVAVEAAMTVDTKELTCGKDGVLMWRLSTAILRGAKVKARTHSAEHVRVSATGIMRRPKDELFVASIWSLCKQFGRNRGPSCELCDEAQYPLTEMSDAGGRPRLLRAVLSSTTTASALSVSRFSVSSEL